MFGKLNSSPKNRAIHHEHSGERIKNQFTWADFSLGVLIITSLLLNGELGTSQKLASANVLTKGSEAATQKVDLTEIASSQKGGCFRVM